MTHLQDTEWQDGDVVCVALVPRGQAVDWSPGSFEPDVAVWVPEERFIEISEAAKQLRVPILPTIDLNAQSRLSSGDCSLMMAAWGGLERKMENTPAARSARAIGEVLNTCSEGGGQTEVLIEGP